MGSLSGILQRPIIAASVVALASISTDLRDKSHPSATLRDSSSLNQPNSSIQTNLSRASDLPLLKQTNLSFLTQIRVPVPKLSDSIRKPTYSFVPNHLYSSVASSPSLLELYNSAKLANIPRPSTYSYSIPLSSSSSEFVYKWHLPDPNAIDLSSNCSAIKSRTVVVLLGWLGAKQRHLKKYADWYTSRGFHVITFTFPMDEILSYNVGGKTEEHIVSLANHLADWLEEEFGNNLVFHTFSNTGWLTYGAILEKFEKQDPAFMGRIKGCIVDSAPVAAPDPQVWASGFSAALLKKRSVASKGNAIAESSNGPTTVIEAKPDIREAALLLILEKFFKVVLNLPAVNRRLTNVVGQLKSGQPRCPQLYIYSSADKVIPVKHVERFIEEQQKSGRNVKACNFISTPHVDHFRHHPHLYSTQLTQFFEDSGLSCSSLKHDNNNHSQ